MKTTAEFTKRALRREPGYPVGVPAPLYVQCECGNKVSVSGHEDADNHETVTCPCGIEYNKRGWIIVRPVEAA